MEKLNPGSSSTEPYQAFSSEAETSQNDHNSSETSLCNAAQGITTK